MSAHYLKVQLVGKNRGPYLACLYWWPWGVYSFPNWISRRGRQNDSKQVRVTWNATGQENRGHYLVWLDWRPWGFIHYSQCSRGNWALPISSGIQKEQKKNPRREILIVTAMRARKCCQPFTNLRPRLTNDVKNSFSPVHLRHNRFQTDRLH